jgi:tagatose 6-phosphate kinase
LIVTVTPNASIDRTYIVENFGVDRINRTMETWVCAGGKGINVARVLKELGRDALATGFVGGQTGDLIVRWLSKEEIRQDFVRVEPESRICVKVMDTKNGTQTEINEPGPGITAIDIDAIKAKIDLLLAQAELLMLCGNCPPGVPPGFYAELTTMAKKRGVRVILDTSGENLAEAVKASPYMVKPNVAELSQLAGAELCTIEEISRAAKSLKQFGIGITSVTMGRSGAIVTDGVQVWQAVPPDIPFASAVGSGDAFLAAFADSLLAAESIQDALAWATAAGAANATTYQAGFCSKKSIMEMRQGVTLTKVE